MLEARRRGKVIAVVTAASKDLVVPVLSRLGLLRAVTEIVALEDVARSKPAPDCYLRALDLLDISPEEAVVFEDSPTGLSAAQAAGVTAVAVGSSLTAADRATFTPYAVDALEPSIFGAA